MKIFTKSKYLKTSIYISDLVTEIYQSFTIHIPKQYNSQKQEATNIRKIHHSFQTLIVTVIVFILTP